MPSFSRAGPMMISSSEPFCAVAHARAARERRVERRHAPVVAVAGRLVGARERRADHHRVGAAGDRLGDVAAVAHAAVGDHLARTRRSRACAASGRAATSAIAVACGTPMPSTPRVVQAAPGPTPTSTPAAPVRIRCRPVW